MGKFRGNVREFMAWIQWGLEQSLKRPHSDRWSKTSVIVWSLATAVVVVNICFNVFAWIEDNAVWWVFPLNLLTLVFDLTMLRWSIQGILYRREARENQARLEAKLRDFYEHMGDLVRKQEREIDGDKG